MGSLEVIICRLALLYENTCENKNVFGRNKQFNFPSVQIDGLRCTPKKLLGSFLRRKCLYGHTDTDDECNLGYGITVLYRRVERM